MVGMEITWSELLNGGCASLGNENVFLALLGDDGFQRVLYCGATSHNTFEP
jgi:hypothetical protein